MAKLLLPPPQNSVGGGFQLTALSFLSQFLLVFMPWFGGVTFLLYFLSREGHSTLSLGTPTDSFNKAPLVHFYWVFCTMDLMVNPPSRVCARVCIFTIFLTWYVFRKCTHWFRTSHSPFPRPHGVQLALSAGSDNSHFCFKGVTLI